VSVAVQEAVSSSSREQSSAAAPDRGWIRALIPLGFLTTIVGLTGALTGPFTALFLSDGVHGDGVHSSPGRISLFLFLSPLVAVGVASAVGRVSDRPNARRTILFASSVAGIAGFSLFAVFRDYWALLAVSLTLLALSGAIMAQILAVGRELMDRDYPTRAVMAMNGLRMMMSFSWAIGAPIGALLIRYIGFTTLYFATAGAYVLVLGVVVALRRLGTSSAPLAAAPSEPDNAPADEDSPPRAVVLGSAAAFTVLSCVTSLTVTTMPLFVSIDLRSSVTNAGLVLGLCASFEVPLMLVFGAMAGRWPIERLLLLGCGFGMLYCLSVAMANSVWQVAVAQAFHACFVCCIGGLGISYFQHLMPSALGRATTMFSNASRFAGMLAGLIFGFVEVHGYRLAFVVSFVLCLLGTAILVVIERRQRLVLALATSRA
jgi:SET family sugar efflux transporter-like MFS transporter